MGAGETSMGGPPANAEDYFQAYPPLSPNSLLPVIPRTPPPGPIPRTRFLHGGPPLSELSSPSAALVSASASWRAFTDEEESRLQMAWGKLDSKKRMKEGGFKLDTTPVVAKPPPAITEVSDVEKEFQDHIVPVGLDSLFSVDLFTGLLSPDFWAGASVRVILVSWFYAPASPSIPIQPHLLKLHPVDPDLALALEGAYVTIRPWESSYSAELSSALKVGAEAEAKLKMPISVKTTVPPGTGGVANVNEIDVIFQGTDTARLYTKGLIGSMGKSFLSSGKAFGGGQVVLRGWDAVEEWMRKKNAKLEPQPIPKKSPVKKKERRGSGSSFAPSVSTPSSIASVSSTGGESAIVDYETDDSATSTPLPRSRKTSATATTLGLGASTGSGFFAALKSKMGVVVAAQDTDQDQADDDGIDDDSDEEVKERNATEEAMDGPRKGESGKDKGTTIGDVDELVLVVHGIGQKLAGTYSSFDFVHAVNQLRTACTTLSTSPSLAPLIHSKRAQFVPVRWRTDLEFDDLDDSEDLEEESLTNRFTLNDIEIKDSVPFVRQVVSGLVLDVPFYLSHHKEKMIRAVVKEANRIYRLFAHRNPTFAKSGRVSIIAHSLGSALTADILSSQPTFVKPLADMTKAELNSEKQFVFDTRVLVLVGSPLAFFLHLGRGQLIARRGRERTKNVPADTALDRARYGCLAIDSIYNCFHQTDPVAFALNPTVDVEYAKIIKPVAIPSTNQTLLQNLADTYNRVSSLLEGVSVSALWSSKAVELAEDKVLEDKKLKEEKDEERDQLSETGPPKVLRRPGVGKRMPSERPGIKKEEFDVLSRAERRMKALNPQGCIDFYLPAEGLNQYVESLSSHGSYWYDPRFATFILTQLFSSGEDLERTGREEIGTED